MQGYSNIRLEEGPVAFGHPRGFYTGEENKRADMLLGVIPIDSIFSPVIRVKYNVESTRIGQRTD